MSTRARNTTTVEDWTRTRYERPITVRRIAAVLYATEHQDFIGIPLPDKEVRLGKEHQWRLQCRICEGWGKGHATQAEAFAHAQEHLELHGGSPLAVLRSKLAAAERWVQDLDAEARRDLR